MLIWICYRGYGVGNEGDREWLVKVDQAEFLCCMCYQRGLERIVNVEVLVIKAVGVGSPLVLKLASRPYTACKEYG